MRLIARLPGRNIKPFKNKKSGVNARKNLEKATEKAFAEFRLASIRTAVKARTYVLD